MTQLKALATPFTALARMYKRIDHQNRVWFVVCSILVIVVATLGLTLYSLARSADADRASSEAVRKALSTAQCVNNVLGTRQSTSTADANATAEIFAGISDVLTAPKGQTAAVYQQFLVTFAKDKAVLDKDKAFRATHPLGQC